jgi:hypothetical protein
MTRAIGKAATGVALALALAACASVSVEEGTERSTLTMPDVIYVADFSTGGNFDVDRTGAELATFKKNLQAMLKAGMVADLTDKLVPAAAVRKSDWTTRKAAWIVCGQFTKVEQGSRLLRGVVGFGAGGTKLETNVQVYDLASGTDTPIMAFSTTGGSGAEPGAVLALSTDPLTLAVGGAGNIAHGLSEDAARTARVITAQLSTYMHDRRWITDERWIQPKHQNATDTF